MTDDRLLFIVGVGRSGTSLLQSMVGAHPEVAVAPETHFLRDYLLDQRRHARVTGLTPAGFRKVLSTSEPFGRAGIDPAEVVPDGAPVDVRAVFLRFATIYARKSGGVWFADKDPNLIDYLPALARAFPRARVLHIYRDPRDVVLSKTKAAWSAGRTYWQHALIGELQLHRGRTSGPAHFGDRYVELAYEELLARPEATLRTACTAVGFTYNPAMLAYTQTARELVADSERSWKKETFRPLKRDNAEKWRRELSPAQIALIERVSPTYFGKLGYQSATFGRSLAGSVLSAVLPLARPLYGSLRKNQYS